MSNEDETVWIVFNGEIYNFVEVRQDLIARGHQFQTRSDTETIVHAWEEFGESCVDKLRGMFAFAIWDCRRQVLFAARDRLGIKPFYYYEDKERARILVRDEIASRTARRSAGGGCRRLRRVLRRRYISVPKRCCKGSANSLPDILLRQHATGSA